MLFECPEAHVNKNMQSVPFTVNPSALGLNMARMLTKLDLRGAYNLVQIRARGKWKTASRTRYGHFEYFIVPFGLTSATTTFQHLVKDIFGDILDQILMAYIDIILICSSDQASHNHHVLEVLIQLH